MARYHILGIYLINPTADSIVKAAEYHNFPWLLNEANEFAEKIIWENFLNLTLFEFQIIGSLVPEELNSIHHKDQSPYLEFYLDEEGIRKISKSETINCENRRICFFIHSTDIKAPVWIGDQELQLPYITKLPARLIPFTHYVPVD